MNVIFGASGHAREICWIIHDIFEETNVDYRPDCYVVKDCDSLVGTDVDTVPVLSESQFFTVNHTSRMNFFVAVGSPLLRRTIVEQIRSQYPQSEFPNLVHPNAIFDRRTSRVTMGVGNVIFPMTLLTTDITIGDFVHVNAGCTISHGSILRNYVTISPGVHLCGNVEIENEVFIGAGVVVKEKVQISHHITVGAGTVVLRNLEEEGTYGGVPARKLTR